MEEILKQILGKLDKLDKLESDISAIKNDIKGIDNDVKQINRKVDSITDAVAQTMENLTELKDKVEKQDVEIRVIKGGK